MSKVPFLVSISMYAAVSSGEGDGDGGLLSILGLGNRAYMRRQPAGARRQEKEVSYL
jgi:hypothetical protein